MKQKAYICSPYSGDVKRNKEYARQLTRWAILRGYVPICPHLYLTEVLNNDDEEERETGLQLGLELLTACKVIIIGKDYGISKGMEAEIEQAKRLGLTSIKLSKARQYETKI